ncbi:MAG: hypothetical protein M9928_19830 [Anaerolineae bacterium]|nr:hypothetical protein [Anaerolineae bacterium]MCO5189778.1 hypothetical protein [Anaerolineae bacterium]MCO5207264.1 hypothetical protein [Anaerolineae bacterium]
MRFLVHEQPYEKRLAAGLLRYSLNGEPVGTNEAWRLTQAPDGFTVLRVDLDSRSAESGNSYLYHLVSDGDGAPQRLTYRFYGGDGTVVKGNVLFEADGTTNSREVNGSRYEDEFSGNGVFFFPSSVGLALLARYPQVETAWTLNMYDEEKLAELFGLVAFRPKITTVDRQTVTIGHTQHNARHVTIAWGDQTRRLWLSDDGWTLKMQRDDGLTALETRTIRT